MNEANVLLHSKFPQLALDLTQQGIDRAAAKVERQEPGWADVAYRMLQIWLTMAPVGHVFTTEQARQAMTPEYSDPAKSSAWGGIIRRAVKSGRIAFAGYANIRQSPLGHCTPVRTWRVMPRATDVPETRL